MLFEHCPSNLNEPRTDIRPALEEPQDIVGTFAGGDLSEAPERLGFSGFDGDAFEAVRKYALQRMSAWSLIKNASLPLP